ncbi:MAG TPA: DUF2249 domain-containing protein [Bryobacteraceae bacterium]|nr:DUF2249 domain-containing protein [Bryobacteraceae bacterium]
MKLLDIHTFNDYDEHEIARRVLLDDPVMRTVLVSLKAGQGLAEHSASGPVTVLTLSGRVTFHEDDESADLRAGALVCLAPGRRHKLQAREDSKLLVTMVKPPDEAAWNSLAPAGSEIDLRATPRERRHPIVFWAFDQLAVSESFTLVNDHDPRPLRAQLEQARPGEIRWEYEVQGPHEFRIRISRVAAAPPHDQETYLAAGRAH